jgi:hypothetical protein
MVCSEVGVVSAQSLVVGVGGILVRAHAFLYHLLHVLGNSGTKLMPGPLKIVAPRYHMCTDSSFNENISQSAFKLMSL